MGSGFRAPGVKLRPDETAEVNLNLHLRNNPETLNPKALQPYPVPLHFTPRPPGLRSTGGLAGPRGGPNQGTADGTAQNKSSLATLRTPTTT